MADPATTFEVLMVVLTAPGLILPLLEGRGRRTPAAVALATLAAALALSCALAAELTAAGPVEIFSGAIRLDPYSSYLGLLATLGALLVAGASAPEVGSWPTSYSAYALMLLALAGVHVMVHVADAVTLVAAWALVAVASYVLAGIRKDGASLQGAMKYGIMGAVSSSLLIYGLGVAVGLTGTARLAGLPAGVDPTMAALGILLLVAAFGFKLGVFPFHGWLPDVYGGVHPILVAYIAGVVKMAAVAGLLRVVVPMAPGLASWLPSLALFAVATMTFGNVAALVQGNVQRMMAYSSIAHAGYLLVGLAAASDPAARALGLQGVALHMTTYVLAKVGIFVALAYLVREGVGVGLEDIRGLGRRMPTLGAAVTVLMLSLMGMPPLIGFWSKFTYLFLSVADAAPWLALAGVLNSGVSVGYYAQVIRYMYFAGGPREGMPRERVGDPAVLVAAAAAALTVLLGLGPAQLLAGLLNP